MDSHMEKMLKSQNTDKEYPSNIGLKWLEDQETKLSEELNKITNIEIITQNHKKKIKRITSRGREIAYKRYLKKKYNEEIIEKDKLYKKSIKQTTDKIKQTMDKIKNLNYDFKKLRDIKNPILLESEIAEMENAIKELNNTLKEICMINFENT
jgi:hypothetical protein